MTLMPSSQELAAALDDICDISLSDEPKRLSPEWVQWKKNRPDIFPV